MTGGQAWNLFVVVVPAWVLLPVGGVLGILLSARRPRTIRAWVPDPDPDDWIYE